MNLASLCRGVGAQQSRTFLTASSTSVAKLIMILAREEADLGGNLFFSRLSGFQTTKKFRDEIFPLNKDRPQSLFYLIPQVSHSQAGFAINIKFEGNREIIV